MIQKCSNNSKSDLDMATKCRVGVQIPDCIEFSLERIRKRIPTKPVPLNPSVNELVAQLRLLVQFAPGEPGLRGEG